MKAKELVGSKTEILLVLVVYLLSVIAVATVRSYYAANPTANDSLSDKLNNVLDIVNSTLREN